MHFLRKRLLPGCCLDTVYGSRGQMFRTLSIPIVLIVIHSWSASDLKNIFIKQFFYDDNPLMFT